MLNGLNGATENSIAVVVVVAGSFSGCPKDEDNIMKNGKNPTQSYFDNRCMGQIGNHFKISSKFYAE